MHRRSFLADSFRGFSGLALAAMLHRDGYSAEPYVYVGPWNTDDNYWDFGLPDPPYGYVWVRYGDDATPGPLRSAITRVAGGWSRPRRRGAIGEAVLAFVDEEEADQSLGGARRA